VVSAGGATILSGNLIGRTGGFDTHRVWNLTEMLDAHVSAGDGRVEVHKEEKNESVSARWTMQSIRITCLEGQRRFASTPLNQSPF
jgi:hypothetical protein